MEPRGGGGGGDAADESLRGGWLLDIEVGPPMGPEGGLDVRREAGKLTGPLTPVASCRKLSLKNTNRQID